MSSQSTLSNLRVSPDSPCSHTFINSSDLTLQLQYGLREFQDVTGNLGSDECSHPWAPDELHFSHLFMGSSSCYPVVSGRVPGPQLLQSVLSHPDLLPLHLSGPFSNASGAPGELWLVLSAKEHPALFSSA